MTGVAPDVTGARLSARLRAARDERGLSLARASEGSKVALRYVRMFEEGDYPMVADPAYLAYFIRRYAAFLGLNELQASREFIAETEDSRAEKRNGTESKPLVVGNHTHTSTVEDKDLQALRPLEFPPRRIPRTRLGRGSRPVGSRTVGSRSRLFNFYAGPLSVIAVAWVVGPWSPLNLWTDKIPTPVSMMERREEPSSAIPVAASTEAIHEPERAATSPASASLPPTTELLPPPVVEPLSAAGKPEVAEVSTKDHPRSAITSQKKSDRSSSAGESHRIATDRASDALRAEQLERMKSAGVSAGA